MGNCGGTKTASASSWKSVEMMLKWSEVANCSRCMKQQQEKPYHWWWTPELAVRSVQTLMTILVFALKWCQLHAKVRHGDIPAPGYADSGRQGPIVCTRHAVVLPTSAGRKEVASRYALEPPFREDQMCSSVQDRLQLVEHVALWTG